MFYRPIPPSGSGSQTPPRVAFARRAAPILKENVYVGAGASLIGAITIGRNARIGANCPVVKDIPDNGVAVIGEVRVVAHGEDLDNTWIENKG